VAVMHIRHHCLARRVAMARTSTHHESGDLRQVAQLRDRPMPIWPGLRGARELAEPIHPKYPRVVVGVITPAEPSTRMNLAAPASVVPGPVVQPPASCDATVKAIPCRK
jgi:hypothetical protein